ncbi:unnamed protein product [Schistosoma margrebowiei]|uniref:Uncharacterized protein n=1 Tax=Schistosoma margrebowiei TaxID=48269 RepID=A0A183MMI7_9TREM|nr:unnamed protein product [Schistosoma margrebowiei]
MNNSTTICHFTNPYQSGIAGILITHVSISLAILGIPANLLTLIVLKRDSSSTTTTTTSGTFTSTSTPATTTTSTTLLISNTISNRNSINFILATLATEDILIILLYSLYYVAIHYYEKYTEQLIYLNLIKYADSPIYFLLSWIKVSEIYTILLLSLQRYLAIRWPLHSTYLCSLGRTKRILYSIFILSFILKLPNLILGYRILIINKQYNQLINNYCIEYKLEEIFIKQTWYRTFKIIYVQVLDQVITFIIPLNILIILNIGLILRVRQATIQRLREDSTGLLFNKSTNKYCNSFCNSNNNNNNMKSNKRKLMTSRSSSTLSSTPYLQHNHHHHHQTQHHAHNRSVTLTLIGVISIFILCETPTTICFCYEFWELLTEITQSDQLSNENANITTTLTTSSSTTTTTTELSLSTEPDFYYYAYPAALLCILIGCTSNFFIYMLIGLKFRRMCIMYLRELYQKIKRCFQLGWFYCKLNHVKSIIANTTPTIDTTINNNVSSHHDHHYQQNDMIYSQNKHCSYNNKVSLLSTTTTLPSSSTSTTRITLLPLSWKKHKKTIYCKHKVENLHKLKQQNNSKQHQRHKCYPHYHYNQRYQQRQPQENPQPCDNQQTQQNAMEESK